MNTLNFISYIIIIFIVYYLYNSEKTINKNNSKNNKNHFNGLNRTKRHRFNSSSSYPFDSFKKNKYQNPDIDPDIILRKSSAMPSQNNNAFDNNHIKAYHNEQLNFERTKINQTSNGYDPVDRINEMMVNGEKAYIGRRIGDIFDELVE